MNPYQVMGVIACCVSLFAGVVTFLTYQGVPVLMAFLGVYLVAVCCMLGMQRRARESSGCAEHPHRHRESPISETRPIDKPTSQSPSVAMAGKSTLGS